MKMLMKMGLPQFLMPSHLLNEYHEILLKLIAVDLVHVMHNCIFSYCTNCYPSHDSRYYFVSECPCPSFALPYWPNHYLCYHFDMYSVHNSHLLVHAGNNDTNHFVLYAQQNIELILQQGLRQKDAIRIS